MQSRNDSPVLRLAIYYHAIAYDTHHLDNEQAVNKIAHVLSDIDLAPLGSPPDDYDLYPKQIRCEYD